MGNCSKDRNQSVAQARARKSMKTKSIGQVFGKRGSLGLGKYRWLNGGKAAA
jgi:hypothetical protein